MKRLFISLALIPLLLSFPSHAQGEGEGVTAVVGSDGVQRVEIVAGSYFFKPEHIIVKVNLPVELSVRRSGRLIPHNIVIDEPDLDLDINESLTTRPIVLRFTPHKTGRYPYYCDKKLLFFKSHRAKGMEGIIEVREVRE